MNEPASLAVSVRRTDDRDWKIAMFMGCLQESFALCLIVGVRERWHWLPFFTLLDWISACGFGIDIDRATKDELSGPTAKCPDRTLNIRWHETDHINNGVETPRLCHLCFKSGVVLSIANNGVISFWDISLCLSTIVIAPTA